MRLHSSTVQVLRRVFLGVTVLLLAHGCIPLLPVDTDGDGFSDQAEITGDPPTDPTNPADHPNNVLDSDGDGCSDYGESTLGQCDGDPNTPVSSVSLSGTVLISAGMVLDGDTRDINNPTMDNNALTLAEAQAVPNPSTVGGYLGSIRGSRDIRDVFRVQLATGQVATLLLADPGMNDFDLFLYDPDGQAVDSSEGVDRAEQVVAPANGTYLVEVYGYSVLNQNDRGGLYSLLIGENTAAAAFDSHRRLSSLDTFVENEVIVRYAPDTKSVRIQRNADMGLETLNTGENAGGFERLRVAQTSEQPRGASGAKHATALRRVSSGTVATIKALRRRSDVQSAEPNYIRRIMTTPDDEFFANQWNLSQISLPQAWELSTGSTEVIVAVVDTGVVLNHPDLSGQLTSGYDFVADADDAMDGDGLDSDPTDPGDSAGGGIPSSFHGTHVAGIVAAHTNNGRGVAGVGWNTSIMPVRSLGRGGTGPDYDIIQGIRYAAGLSNDSGTVPERRADIINLSLGGPGFSSLFEAAVGAARNAGVIVIGAAGNENTNADQSYPAAFDSVVSVSAVDYSGQRAPYSNTGSTIAVAAPGGNMEEDDDGDGLVDGILSTLADDNGKFIYALYEGTSMAVPHVAGVAALMKAVNPDLAPSDFDLLLAGTHPASTRSIVDDLGSPGKDTLFGYGLINALSAVQAAAEVGGDVAASLPVLRVTPTDLYLGDELDSADVVVTNNGGGDLVVTGVAPSESWITVLPVAGGEGTYTISATRTGLADGVYSGRVVFSSNGGAVTVPVRMTVGEAQVTGGDVGTLYVLLVDPDSLETIQQAETSAAAGYAFTFSNVPAGDYRLYAGTDIDEDLYINTLGEAFGGYPVASKTEILDATTSLRELSFSAAYQVNIQVPADSTSAQSASNSTAHLLQREATKSVR